MNTVCGTREAGRLLHEGAMALSKVESSGICIDVKYLDRLDEEIDRRVGIIRDWMRGQKMMKVWRKMFGDRLNLSSRAQLGEVFKEVMKDREFELTASGRVRTGDDVLAHIDDPFVEKYRQMEKYLKLKGTFLRGIQREVVNGKVHPFFNLHTVLTYRSSCDSPNFQNIPNRDPEIAPLIRRAVVPRKGRYLVGVDYSGAEVSIAACYHKDPRMIDYLEDDSKDMHRDAAAKCFCLPSRKVSGPIRHVAKNKFVFPQFYGDWYESCARNMWKDVSGWRGDQLGDRRRVMAGLRRRGIEDYDEFESHVQEVEDVFWNDTFHVYRDWKDRWYELYEKRGWVKLKTGFVCRGHMRRNEAINYPIQGAAFHCLLWSLNEMVLRQLPRLKMKTLVVGQIHDEMVFDVPKEELAALVALCKKVMVEKLLSHWRWITVPMRISFKVYPRAWHKAEPSLLPEGVDDV